MAKKSKLETKFVAMRNMAAGGTKSAYFVLSPEEIDLLEENGFKVKILDYELFSNNNQAMAEVSWENSGKGIARDLWKVAQRYCRKNGNSKSNATKKAKGQPKKLRRNVNFEKKFNG